MLANADEGNPINESLLNDFRPPVVRAQPYCYQFGEDMDEYVSNCNHTFAILWLFLDVIQLYCFYLSLSLYYINGIDGYYGISFVNDTMKRVFETFVMFHLLLTFLPMPITLLIRINRDYYSDQYYGLKISFFTKLSLFFYTFIQFYWLRVGLGPHLTI